MGLAEYLSESDGAELVDHPEDSDQEAKVPDPVHDECLFGGIAVVDILKPIPDQQVRAESHPFPTDEQDHIVGAQHQQQHGEDKEIEIGKIAGIMRGLFLMHICRGIHMDKKAHAGNDQQEQYGKLVHLEGKRYMQLPYTDKVEKRDHHRFKTLLSHLPEDQQAENKSRQKDTASDKTGQ